MNSKLNAETIEKTTSLIVPTTRPAKRPEFVPRHKTSVFLNQAIRTVAAQGQLVVIVGPTGYGKTELAKSYCDEHPEARLICAMLQPELLKNPPKAPVIFVDEAHYARHPLQFLARLNEKTVVVLLAQDIDIFHQWPRTASSIVIAIPSWLAEGQGQLPELVTSHWPIVSNTGAGVGSA